MAAAVTACWYEPWERLHHDPPLALLAIEAFDGMGAGDHFKVAGFMAPNMKFLRRRRNRHRGQCSGRGNQMLHLRLLPAGAAATDARVWTSQGSLSLPFEDGSQASRAACIPICR
jgi:hypothetical protein